MLKFDDGVQFDTSGEYRITRRHDGLYVVGHGVLMAVDSRDEGREVIASFTQSQDDDADDACTCYEPGCDCEGGNVCERCAVHDIDCPFND